MTISHAAAADGTDARPDAAARKAVEGEPRLTEGERAEIARVWLTGADGGTS